MRIIPLLCAAITLLASTPAAAQLTERGVVFAVSRADDGDAVLQAMTILVPDGFAMPVHEPSDSALRAFTERWLPAGRVYDVLAAGERAGTVALHAPEEPVCLSLLARGTLDIRPAPGADWQGLAGQGLPPQPGAPWLRAPSFEEKRELDGMAAALLDAHGIRTAGRTRADTAAATLLVHPNARPVLVGSYVVDQPAPVFRRAALLVVAEEDDEGYRPAYAWFHEGVEAAVESRALVDAADLDGDGMPELVVRNDYYEHSDFTILRRTEHGWIAVYRGGRGAAERG